MGKTSTRFLLRDEFESWLKSYKNIDTGNQYKILDTYKSMKSREKDSLEEKLYYDIIGSLLYHGYPQLAYSVSQQWYDNSNWENKNYGTYWRRYDEFIRSLSIVKVRKYIDKDQFARINKLIISEDDLFKYKLINKVDIKGLNGMDSLLSAFTNENEFIKLAIESTYFFDAEEAKIRFSEIESSINGGKLLPARKSQKDDKSARAIKGRHISQNRTTYYEDENSRLKCPIILDGNGNAKVCQEINKRFGYSLSSKVFENFIISHIWGRAFDPRYFTNLWNILLVPAWANHLLDKNSIKGTLISKLKSTLEAICIEHYGLAKLKREINRLHMEQPKCECENDVVHGEYTIQYIEQKGKKQMGSIKIKTIKI